MRDAVSDFIGHVRELRRRVAISVLAFILGFAVCYGFVEVIYQWLVQPLARIMPDDAGRRMIYTGMTEAFFTYVKLAAFGGFAITFPVIAWQLYGFIAPGLYRRERQVVLPFLLLAPGLFIAGAAMVYYVVFPLAWRFFFSFEIPVAEGALPIVMEPRVSEYLSLVMRMIIGFGLAFQLPVVILLLAKAGWVTRSGLASKRKYAVVGIFALAALLTPPDVVSQIILALPLMLLYEGSVFAAGAMERKDKKNA